MSKLNSVDENVIAADKTISIETVVDLGENTCSSDAADCITKPDATDAMRHNSDKWQKFYQSVFDAIGDIFASSQTMQAELYEPLMYRWKFNSMLESCTDDETLNARLIELERCLMVSGELSRDMVIQLIYALDGQSEFTEQPRETKRIHSAIKRFVDGPDENPASTIKYGNVLTLSDHECIAAICKAIVDVCTNLCGAADGPHIASQYTKVLVRSIHTCKIKSTFRRHSVQLWKCLKEPDLKDANAMNPNAILQLMFALFGDTTAPTIIARSRESLGNFVPIDQNILAFISMLRVTGTLQCEKSEHFLQCKSKKINIIDVKGKFDPRVIDSMHASIASGESRIGTKCSKLKH